MNGCAPRPECCDGNMTVGKPAHLTDSKLDVAIWLDVNHIHVPTVKIAVHIDSCAARHRVYRTGDVSYSPSAIASN